MSRLPRYSDHDPERGCGLILATAFLVIVVLIVVLILARITGLWA